MGLAEQVKKLVADELDAHQREIDAGTMATLTLIVSIDQRSRRPRRVTFRTETARDT